MMGFTPPRLGRFLLPAALAVSACVPGFGGPPVPEGWTRVEGLLLPAESGPYHLQHVEAYPIPALGSYAAYAVPRDEPQTVPPFDVFVYPMGGYELEEHVAAARGAMRDYDAATPEIADFAMGPTTIVQTVHAEHPIYVTRMTLMRDGVPVRSFMYITRIRDRFFKVRVSYNDESDVAVDRAMNRRVELLVDAIARELDGR